MRKIWTIAAREYRAMVGTRAFLISIIMMPILLMGGLLAMELTRRVAEVKTRKIAVIDHSDFAFQELASAAEKHTRTVQKSGGVESELPGAAVEIYELELVRQRPVDDALRLDLSDRVRRQELHAFVEIPANVLDTSLAADNHVLFYSQDSSISLARRWFNNTLGNIVRDRRIERADIPRELLRKVRDAERALVIDGKGLLTRGADGSAVQTEEKDVMSAIFLPLGVMMLMFMVIFMASQPMLESVLEEKSQRIAEVLLGSANPFQIMMGKLLGTVGGSLTIFGIYLAGAWAMAIYRGWNELIPFELIPWFIAFQIVGVFFYASIFLAVGASVSQLKEAQSMLLPVWMLLMLPLFIWFIIVQDPLGRLATWISLFPPATPTTMMLRLATGQQIPTWQPIVGLLVTMLTTLLIVAIAGRIFRVGILWQGKTPRVSELLRWALFG